MEPEDIAVIEQAERVVKAWVEGGMEMGPDLEHAIMELHVAVDALNKLDTGLERYRRADQKCSREARGLDAGRFCEKHGYIGCDRNHKE